jgi:hypothetical protein
MDMASGTENFGSTLAGTYCGVADRSTTWVQGTERIMFMRAHCCMHMLMTMITSGPLCGGMSPIPEPKVVTIMSQQSLEQTKAEKTTIVFPSSHKPSIRLRRPRCRRPSTWP